MFYRDPALFSQQWVVDRYVDDLACTFGVPRLFLNVVTALGIPFKYSPLTSVLDGYCKGTGCWCLYHYTT
jgi:hypothetical protein